MCKNESEDTDDANRSEYSLSNQVLELEYKNAKYRLDTQEETIRFLSKEGARYFRFLLILIGVPVAVLGAFDPTTLAQLGNSILSNEALFDTSSAISIGYATLFGSFCILVSIIANITAGGNEAYNTQNRSNPNDIDKAIKSNEYFSKYLEIRLGDYRDRIEQNDELIFSIDRILTIGKVTLSLGILTISMVAYRLLIGEPVSTFWFIAGIALFLLVLAIFSHVTPDRLFNRKKFLSFDPPYPQDYKKEKGEKENTSDSSERDKETE